MDTQPQDSPRLFSCVSRFPQAAAAGSITPLAYLAGPVKVEFGEDGAATVAALEEAIDLESRTVTSVTGQLRWNFGSGICTLSAPKAQGATGRLGDAGAIDLGAVTIESGNDYATVLVVSMDGNDLAASGRVLVQVGTTARPHGWETRDLGDGAKEVVSLGSSPWNIEDTKLKLQIDNDAVSEAALLDANGVPSRALEAVRSGGRFVIDFPPDAMYVILTKSDAETAEEVRD